MRATEALIVGLGAGLLLLVPGRGDAEWSPVRTLGDHAATPPRIVANDRGDVVVAWGDARGGIMTRSARRGGRFRSPSRIPKSDRRTYPIDFELAIDARGDVIAAWEDSDRVVGAVRPAGHGWRPAHVLSNLRRAAELGTVAIAETGAWVTWSSRGEHRDEARGTDASFYFGRPIDVGFSADSKPLVSATSRGALVQWWRETSTLAESIVGRLVVRGGPVGPRNTYARGEPYAGLQIRTATDGRQAALWHNGTVEGPVKLAVRRPGYRFGRVRKLSHPKDTVLTHLAMAPSGDAAMVMTSLTAKFDPRRVTLATAVPGGRFGAPQTLRARSGTQPHVAVGSSGTAAATWLGLDDRSVAVAVRRGRRGFGRAVRLGRANTPELPGCLGPSDLSCFSADVAVGGHRVFAAWMHGLRVRLARHSPSPASK